MTQLSLNLPPAAPGEKEPFLRRVTIRNYKSIGKCDVRLARLSVLVGRNGAGKSNFLDALRFIADSLQSSLDHAIKSRGGVASVRRTSTGHPRNFALRVEFATAEGGSAVYAFEIAARTEGAFSVKTESLDVRSAAGGIISSYRVRDGVLQTTHGQPMPRAVPDRLYLVAASGVPEFRCAYDALTSMGFYNLNPESMKELQSPDAGELLRRDGDNIASVIGRLDAEAHEEKARAERYLSKIVDGIVGVNRVQLGPRETVEFAQQVAGAKHPWRFYAANMSDGTLRALGTLIAVSQLVHVRDRIRLVGIEEPETALHPAAARALMSAIGEATDHTQVLLTTHSADLLDAMDTDGEGILAVVARQGETMIAPLDQASRSSIRDHLYNAGELLRMDQLEPDEDDVRRQKTELLFEDAGDMEP